MTVADCLRIEAARKAARRRLMLNFSIRFSGAARAIRERLGTPLVSPRPVHAGAGGPDPLALAPFARRRAAIRCRCPRP